MIYRRRVSPLHSARAAVGCVYCLALAVAALTLSDPIVLAGVAIAVTGAGVAAGVGRQLGRAALFALPVAASITVINALVTRDGLTVIVRLGDLPVLGQTDITLQAVVYGAVLGLRAMILIPCGVLYTTAVDPDEVLRLFRRFSFRSALSATLATRMVPVLIRDGRHLADAQRCRPGPPPSRMTLMRVACGGMLDRALDVAAALEVRGYGAARRPPARRAGRDAYSRHDLAFLFCAVAIVVLAVGARAAGLVAFSAYPSLQAPTTTTALAISLALVLCALAPFADRRGLRT